MDIIANKKIENLPFDKTILCTITDDINKDEGEYEVSFSGSQSKVTHFTAYAQEGAEYNKNDNVYVNVPQNDFSQQKTIIRKYISDQTSPINYINPMEKFIKIFPTQEENDNHWWWNASNGAKEAYEDEWSLKANGEVAEIPIIKIGFTEHINQFDCLGVSAFFKSLLREYDPVEGEYGLRFEFIGLKDGWDTAEHIEDYYVYKTDTFSSDEMYGLVYGYGAYQKQEKIINLQDFAGTIAAMQVYFYQNKNFKYYKNGVITDIPGDTIQQTKEQYTSETDPITNEVSYVVNTITVDQVLPHDLFIKDLTLSFGYLIDNTYDKELRLYTTSSSQYDESLSNSSNEKTLKLRWLEENSSGIYTTIDEYEDKEASWWDNKSVYLYKYTYGKDGEDEYAGTFWERVASWSKYKNAKKAREVKQEDGKYKYIPDQGMATVYTEQRDNYFSIDVPNVGIDIFNNFFDFKINITDSDEASEFVRYKVIIIEQDIKVSDAPYTTELYYDDNAEIPSSKVITGSNYWVASDTTKQIYESNEITFYNKDEVAGKAAMALIDGLELKCMDNSNGIYRIYGEDNKISAQINSKTMTLRANFNAIHILGLDSGEANITWYYPKNNTMFVSPVNEGSKQVVVYNKAEEEISDSELLSPSDGKEYYIKYEENYYQIIPYTFAGESSETPSYERNGQKYKRASSQDIYIKGTETIAIQSWSANKDENYYVLEQSLNIEQYGDADRVEPVSNEITYTIKSFYSSIETNNTIKCKISRYGRDYWAEKEFFFGHQGNNGTNYAFDISLEREYGTDTDPTSTPTNSTIVPFLKIIRDQNGNTSASNNPWIKVKPTLIYGQKEITDNIILSKVRWSLYAKTTYDGVASHEPSILIYNSSNGYYTGSEVFIKLNTNNIGKINPGAGEKAGDSIILKAELVKQVTFKEGNITNEGTASASSTESDVTKSITLTAYLPIAIADFYQENAEHKFTALDISFYEGATSILYNNYGSDPIYYEGEHKLLNSNSQKISGVNWKIFTNDATNIKKINYYPNMVKSKILNDGVYTEVDEWLLKPTSMFFTGLTKEVSIQAILGGRVIYSQPLLILQNAYGNQTINQWDGSLKIDNENNYILSAMIGAGKKDSNNRFSGVLLGDIGSSTTHKTGIYGYGEGVQTYGFREDGTAFIGASGASRIEFDGSTQKGTISGGQNSTLKQANKNDGYTMTIDLADGKLIGIQKTPHTLIGTEGNSKGFELYVSKITTDTNTYYKNNNNYYNSSNGEIYSEPSSNLEPKVDYYEYIFDAQATTYPLKIGDNFKVQWDGTLRASGAILGDDTQLEGMALNTNNVALSAYISALKILTENNKTQLSNTYSIYAETQNDVLIQNHAVGNTTSFQTYYVNENTNTSPSTYTWYKKIKTSNADNPFGYTLDSSNSAITFSSSTTYYIIKCSLKTENVTTYNDQGVSSTTSITGIDEEQAGDFYDYSGTLVTGYGSLYGKSYFKKLTDKELQSYNITLVSKNGLLRANNAIISGTIYANAGEIGGWSINPTKLTSTIGANTITLDPNAQTSISINGQTRESLVISAGSKFGVTSDGTLYANSANLSSATVSGTLTAGSGSSIGPWVASANSLYYKTGTDTATNRTREDTTTDNSFCLYPSGHTVNSKSNIVLHIGSSFYVDKTGKLYASNVDLGSTLDDFVVEEDIGGLVSTAISDDDTIVFVDTNYSSNGGYIYTGEYQDTTTFVVYSWNPEHTSYTSSSIRPVYGNVKNYYIDETTGKIYQSKYDSNVNDYRWSEVTSSFNSTAFKVSNKGLLTCANAVVTGTIFASAGNIGGWTINKDYIYSSNGPTSLTDTENQGIHLGGTTTGINIVLPTPSSSNSYSTNFTTSNNTNPFYSLIALVQNLLSTLFGYNNIQKVTPKFFIREKGKNYIWTGMNQYGLIISSQSSGNSTKLSSFYGKDLLVGGSAVFEGNVLINHLKGTYTTTPVSATDSTYYNTGWNVSITYYNSNTYSTSSTTTTVSTKAYGLCLNTTGTENGFWENSLYTILKNYNPTQRGSVIYTYPMLSNFTVDNYAAFIRGFGSNSTQPGQVFVGIKHVESTINANLNSSDWTSGDYTAFIKFNGDAKFAALQCNSLKIKQGDNYYDVNLLGSSTTDWSDIRLKQNLQKITNLDLYDNLIPYSFEWKENNKKSYGFIAQDIEKLSQNYKNNSDTLYYKVDNQHPEYIDEDKEYRINYQQFHALHVAKNHQQDDRIKQLEKEVKILQNEIKELREKGGK